MPTKRTKPSTQDKTARVLLKQLCAALDEKKVEDLIVLDVSEHSTITNYIVVASGNSEPHLRALRIELERVLKDTGTAVLGVDQSHGSGWTVVDAFDVMIHVLTTEHRARYRLESLWSDAKPVDWKRLSAGTAARKPAKKKTAVVADAE